MSRPREELSPATVDGTDGWLTPDGLFVARRPRAGWLYDVWCSVEGFKLGTNVALVAANCRSLDDAAREAKEATR